MDPAILDELDKLASQPLSILKLREPITNAVAPPPSRRSNASTASLDTPTPSSLEADLAHYKELFAKLRFSYVEQVTKEKFIRSIVGEPPLIVEPGDNIALEKENLAAKAKLKGLKLKVAEMVEELERRARDLSRRSENVSAALTTLKELPKEIEGIEESLRNLRTKEEAIKGAAMGNPELVLPLTQTLEILEERKVQAGNLHKELEQLRARVPRKRKELERLKMEVIPIENKMTREQAAAKEAKRRKEAALGGVEDDLEDRARWFRATEALLTEFLEEKK